MSDPTRSNESATNPSASALPQSSPGLTCPSGPAAPGSVLFGVIAQSGQVAYLNPNIPVTTNLLRSLASQDITPENRLRFASKCLEARCVQWKGNTQSGRCGLIDHGINVLQPNGSPEKLPLCGIRHTCRWFAQHQRAACSVCPEVIRRPAGQCQPDESQIAPQENDR